MSEMPEDVIERFFGSKDDEYRAFHENMFADNTMSKGKLKTFLQEYAVAIGNSVLECIEESKK